MAGQQESAARSPSAPPAGEIMLASRAVSGGLLETDISVPGARCASCIKTIETALSRIDQVVEARVNLTTRRVKVKWRRTNTPPPLIEALAQAGFDATLSSGPADARDEEMGRLVRATAVAGFAMMNIMLLSVSVWSGADPELRQVFHVLSAILAAPVIIYSGRIFFFSAWTALKAGKVNMDVPVSVGILLTFALSAYDTAIKGPHAYFDAATSLIFVLLVGRTLDHMMRRKARTAVLGLARLMPRGATVLAADGTRTFTPIDRIQPGQIIKIASGDRIPLDGAVTAGEADIDAAIVSGESSPLRVRAGSAVLGGMLTLNGDISVRVTHAMHDSFVATMINMMEAAEHGRARYRRLSDRAAVLYAPVVHTLAAASFAAWFFVTGDWHHALTIAVSVLIITCPCALGLAVPMVHVMAAQRLFELNIAVKDGDALERLASADAAVFDKTGTLTLGRLTVTGRTAGGAALDAAAALAAQSRHPVAQAVAALRERDSALDVQEFVEHPGLGLEGRIGDHLYRLGRAGWAQGGQPTAGPATFTRDGTALGTFEFSDMLRPQAGRAVEAIRARGLPVEILSGDNEANVAGIAHALGVKDYSYGLTPEEKVRRLEDLRRAGRKVLMVGDGLNDAPALSAAHVSIAPASAADVGRAAADFVFLDTSLNAVPNALAIAERTRELVHQNFAIAVLYNIIAIPVALAGFVTPLLAAVAMSASSIIVVLNSLRWTNGSALARPAARPVSVRLQTREAPP